MSSVQFVRELKQKYILEQRQLCAKYAAAYVPSHFNQVIGIALQTFEKEIAPINGLRHPSESVHSTNWYIWCGEYQTEEHFFQPVHLHHLLNTKSTIIKYLGLAPGWRFLMDDNGYEDVWYDADLLNI